MTQTFTVQMRTNRTKPVCCLLGQAIKKQCAARGVVLAELIIVIVMISMMAAMVTLNFASIFGRTDFQRQAYDFINTLKMAANASAETDRRYAVILYFDEQTYVLRQFAAMDLETIDPDEAILKTGYFTETCQLDYVLFDDFEDTSDDENINEARFMAGKAGWVYGGKIVLRDGDGNAYSVIINRLNKVVTLENGDVEFLEPKYKEDVPF